MDGVEDMSSAEIDKLCFDWLEENYGRETASKYTTYSLIIPAWNSYDLNEALETFRQLLYISFGPDESFGTIDYHEARKKLSLVDDSVPIPEVFVRAFAGAYGGD